MLEYASNNRDGVMGLVATAATDPGHVMGILTCQKEDAGDSMFVALCVVLCCLTLAAAG